MGNPVDIDKLVKEAEGNAKKGVKDKVKDKKDPEGFAKSFFSSSKEIINSDDDNYEETLEKIKKRD